MGNRGREGRLNEREGVREKERGGRIASMIEVHTQKQEEAEVPLSEVCLRVWEDRDRGAQVIGNERCPQS